MNFLAHLFLADRDAESLIGNLAGDFVKGPLHDRFTPRIREGIMQHRRLDSGANQEWRPRSLHNTL